MISPTLVPITTAAATFGKVAVLLGGNSAERDVSLASGQAVLSALVHYGINAQGFDTKYRSICELKDENFDRVFIALHGRGGEDGSIQGALEQLGLPYTGSGVTGSALSIDKVLSKLIWHARKLPTADYMVVTKSDFKASDAKTIMATLGNSVMVKPSLEGSSLGMAKASNEQDLVSAIKTAFEYDQQVLIEAFITGPEYTVSILGDIALPSITMKSASGFYDYFAKYQANTTQYHCPSGLSDADEQYVQHLSLEAFKALQSKGWGRIDLMRDGRTNKDGEPCGAFYLLESNTVPGMTKTSLVPKAAKQAGLSFEQLVVHILAQTLTQKTQANIGVKLADDLLGKADPKIVGRPMENDKAIARPSKTGQLSIPSAELALASDTEKLPKKTPFLIGFPIFLLVLALLSYAGFGAYQWLQDEQRLPVQDIVISGDITMLNELQLKSVVRNQAKGSFFALDVDHVHKLMEMQPWVYNASVRKRWPSKLYIHVVEQKAVAIWNDDLLLNRYGDTFEGLTSYKSEQQGNEDFDLTEKQTTVLQKLPQLFGPMGSEKTALTGYTHMQRLLNTNGQKITLLSLSERFAWQAKLNNEVLLKLGRQEYINRLQRYIDVYPLLQQQEKSVAYVDLRYDTGLAVGWGAVHNSNGLGLKATNNNS